MHEYAVGFSCMTSNYHTTANISLRWYKCKQVSFDGDIASWELSETAYDLAKCYSREPHRKLMRAKDDGSLRTWVKHWGPLRFSLEGPPRGCDPIEDYRAFRDRLAWVAGLLASIEQPERQRAILSQWRQVAKFSELFYPEDVLIKPLAIPGLVLEGHDENMQDWLESAKPKEINRVCIHLVEVLVPTNTLRYTVDQSKRGSVV